MFKNSEISLYPSSLKAESTVYWRIGRTRSNETPVTPPYPATRKTIFVASVFVGVKRGGFSNIRNYRRFCQSNGDRFSFSALRFCRNRICADSRTGIQWAAKKRRRRKRLCGCLAELPHDLCVRACVYVWIHACELFMHKTMSMRTFTRACTWVSGRPRLYTLLLRKIIQYSSARSSHHATKKRDAISTLL